MIILMVLYMSKKSREKKVRLGKKIKQARRIPLVAMLKTHRKKQFNLFARNWRRHKLKMGIK